MEAAGYTETMVTPYQIKSWHNLKDDNQNHYTYETWEHV